MPHETTTGVDPYETVLADLKARREQIDQAILAIEGLRFTGTGAPSKAVQPSTNQADPALSNGDIGPGSLLGMSISDATKKILAIKRITLRNPELAVLFRSGGLILNSKDWTNTIGAVLTRRSVDVGDIVKVDRGTWGLKEWYPGRSFKKDDKPEKVDSGEKEEAKATPELPPRSSIKEAQERLKAQIAAKNAPTSET